MDNKTTKIQNLIPLGSVVKLKELDKKIMITKYLFDSSGDYVGVLWPFGDVNDNNKLIFNTNDIEKTIFKGMANNELESYKQKMLESIEHNMLDERGVTSNEWYSNT